MKQQSIERFPGLSCAWMDAGRKTEAECYGFADTDQRTLIGNTANAGLQKQMITADDVRGTGLLKDRIVITCPDDPTRNNDKGDCCYEQKNHPVDADGLLLVRHCGMYPGDCHRFFPGL
jgi:hypothetical protein